MKQLLVFLLVFSAASCQFFETEKVSTQAILEEELKTIDWKDVDQYPAFTNCKSLIEKSVQKECFTNTITQAVYKKIETKNFIAHTDLNNTATLFFEVSKEGKLQVTSVKMDSIVQASFPNLQEMIVTTIDSLQPVAPAYKRGVPVKTAFQIPLLLSTEIKG